MIWVAWPACSGRAALDAGGRPRRGQLGRRPGLQHRAGECACRSGAFVAKARSFGAAVRLERAPAAQTQAFYGGQAIYRGRSRCSAGFNTCSGSGRNYVLTAGHCANSKGPDHLRRPDDRPGGRLQLPGNDYGAIRISNPAARPRGGVLHNGAFRDITGQPGPGRLQGLQDWVDHGHDLRHRPGLHHRELRRGDGVRPHPDQHLHPAGRQRRRHVRRQPAQGIRPAAPSAAAANPGSAASSSLPTRP